MIQALVTRKTESLTRLRQSLPSEWPDLVADLLVDAGEVASRAREPHLFKLFAFDLAMGLESSVHADTHVSSLVERLFKIAYKVRRYNADAVRERLRRSVRLWLGAMPAAALVDNTQVRRTSEFINAHLGEKLTHQTLSKVSGCSSSYLDRAFRRAFDMSLHDYIVRTRIQHAIELLLNGEKVSSVIADVGYRNKTSFNHAFHALTGTTPGKFRRWARDVRQARATRAGSGMPLNAVRRPLNDLAELRTLFPRIRT